MSSAAATPGPSGRTPRTAAGSRRTGYSTASRPASTSSTRPPGPTAGRGSSADAAAPDPGTSKRSPTGCSRLDPRLPGLEVEGEPGYPVPQVVAIGLPATVEVVHPLVVGPEEVEPRVPGRRRRPLVLHVVPCSHVVPADREVGAVTRVQPDVRALGRFGDERELEEQVCRGQGDTPGDQVTSAGDLADVEGSGAPPRSRASGSRSWRSSPSR